MNHFAVFSEEPAPGIDLDRLKTRFFQLSAELHPDKVTAPAEKKEAEDRFAALNKSYETLRHTRSRLLHYLELQGAANSAHVQSVPRAALDLFEAVAEQTRRADELLKQKPAASSPMLKVQFFEKALAATAEIQNIQFVLSEKVRQIESGIGHSSDLGALQEAAAALGFLERWNAQLQQRLAALAF